jgi:hypothetical protein
MPAEIPQQVVRRPVLHADYVDALEAAPNTLAVNFDMIALRKDLRKIWGDTEARFVGC